MICPRCEQDHVIQARVKATGADIFVCPECEATWFSMTKVGVETFVDYGTYMESVGLTQLWTELEIIS